MSRDEAPVAVVTGAGRPGGIGREIAAGLLADGYRVIVSDLATPMSSHPDYESATATMLDRTASGLAQTTGGDVLAVPCDVRRAAEVDALFAAAVDTFGRLDVAVNNAGLAVGLTDVVDLSEADWRLNLDVMATGTFLCSRAAARILVRQGRGGRIINMASQAGKTGQPSMAAYTAAKFAVLGFTQSLAHELGPHGVTVNAVCPGTVLTPLLDVKGGVFETYPKRFGIDPERYKTKLLRQIPLGRFAVPGDIADMVRFLASPRAAYVTGESINVTGGQEMH
ncbi:SDR family NAD(P)-dependent oxidoreductase [Verrucosispora sp. WMMD573]|uniref:SDR family NAD(P)-dependent oxidoreductase n=1 Tax=Verrucosispora sp. WMMD573 TaxID=3015149 RepID=UPI00248B19D0|nr:SDR family NAD(P)-dependent oxidoreductase [Verrucosispora sp. WMMD573]WBB52486.1 SDR family NAD(P)-dependent oxidoreductase [Verrucosispora sp. WMMD573]